jgi:2-C-methyl-D-erythritol 2,4-cyclodiphosphate synthase
VSTSFRIGHGYDIHRLQDGGKLVVGGVVVAEGISPVAHSDGDVVAHAVVDALLGAMAMGDIGEHFPNSDPQWRGASSRVFLARSLELVVDAGFRPHNLDITIMAERPKLKPFKRQMVAWLAEVLEMSAFRINVKAGTNEGCDAIGRGEAIAAHAVVLVEAIDDAKPAA